MRISVAMATYNGGRFLQDQLESLAGQTRRPCELVVCDDGSCDRTVDIIRAFATSAPFPVKVFRNDSTIGHRRNFLKAATNCAGDWIAFCDQDDVWLPNKLEIVSEVLRSTRDVVLVVHAANLVDRDLQFFGRRLPNIKKNHVVKRYRNNPWSCPPGFSLVFHSALLTGVQWEQPPPKGHDQLVYYIANIVGNTAYVAMPLVLYRRHEETATNHVSSQPKPHQAAQESVTESHEKRALRWANDMQNVGAFLSAMADSPNHGLRGVFLEGSAFYMRLSMFMLNRAQLYTASSFLQYAGFFLGMVWRGAYRTRGKGGIGFRAGCADLLAFRVRNSI